MSVLEKFQNKRLEYLTYIRPTQVTMQQIIDKEQFYINAYLTGKKRNKDILDTYLIYYSAYLHRLFGTREYLQYTTLKLDKKTETTNQYYIIPKTVPYITYILIPSINICNLAELGYDISARIKARKITEPQLDFLFNLSYEFGRDDSLDILGQYIWFNFLTAKGLQTVYFTILLFNIQKQESFCYVVSDQKHNIISAVYIKDEKFISNKSHTIYIYKDSLIVDNDATTVIQNNFYNEVYIPSVFKELDQYLINDLSTLIVNYL